MSDKKGKPTPKRKIAEAKLKVSSLSPGASKEAKRALKDQARKRRMESRAAYMRGEESALPLREIAAQLEDLLEPILMNANLLPSTS